MHALGLEDLCQTQSEGSDLCWPALFQQQRGFLQESQSSGVSHFPYREFPPCMAQQVSSPLSVARSRTCCTSLAASEYRPSWQKITAKLKRSMYSRRLSPWCSTRGSARQLIIRTAQKHASPDLAPSAQIAEGEIRFSVVVTIRPVA